MQAWKYYTLNVFVITLAIHVFSGSYYLFYYSDISHSYSFIFYKYIYIYHHVALSAQIYIYIYRHKLGFNPRSSHTKDSKKWYLMLPYLTLSIIRYLSRVKWSNPGKGVAPFPTSQCSSYWKGSLLVTLDCSCKFLLPLTRSLDMTLNQG